MRLTNPEIINSVRKTRMLITRMELFAMDCEDQDIEQFTVAGFLEMQKAVEKIAANYIDIEINGHMIGE